MATAPRVLQCPEHRFRPMLEHDVPEGIPYTSVLSLDDGVIDWRACLDPQADTVEVSYIDGRGRVMIPLSGGRP